MAYLRPLTALALLVALAVPAMAQPVLISGAVIGSDGDPVPSASLYVDGTLTGDAADADGRFAFEVPAPGPIVLVVSSLGYREERVPLQVPPSGVADLVIVLDVETTLLEGPQVTASAITTGSGVQATLSTVDVLTTPGSAADLYRAIQTFPGTAVSSDDADLYVRGGDAEETLTFVDGAPLTHPYRYESPTTSSLGTIPPLLAEGTAFAAGGFSARYGNALSGVLEIDTRDAPEQRSVVANAGVAAVSLGADAPVGERFGVRASANRSTTALLFWLNGQRQDFETPPQSVDLNAALHARYSKTGTLKTFSYVSASQFGVRVDEPSFSAIYRGDVRNQLHNVQLKQEVGPGRLTANAGVSLFANDIVFGETRFTPSERSLFARANYEFIAASTVLSFGGDVDVGRARIEGVVPPLDGTSAEPEPFEDESHGTRIGGYAEAELFAAGALRLGVRSDVDTRTGQVVLDPRAAYALDLDTWQLTVAAGLYSQFPRLDVAAQAERELRVQRARHLILGVERQDELFGVDDVLLRAEAYHKQYDGLVVGDETAGYQNSDGGWSRGLDLFALFGETFLTRFNGRLAYSFLQTDRAQLRQTGDTTLIERGPASFDATHNLKGVIGVTVSEGVNVGASLLVATGRAVTPVTGAVDQGGVFLPVEGAVGSERLPTFSRIDLQVQHLRPLGDHSLVLYASVTNALDRGNVVGYEYAPDYSERTERVTDFNRSVYFGAVLTLAY